MNISAVVSVALTHATCITQCSFRQRLSLVMMVSAILWNPAHAQVDYVAAPSVSVGVYSINNTPTYSASVSSSPDHPLPYFFDASIDIPGGNLSKGDVYFGFIFPGGNTVLTLVADGGTPSLKSGLAPLAQGIDMWNKSTFTASSVLGGVFQYAFKQDDPHGMYMIFALLVFAGTDPTNAQNWYRLRMAPLVLQQ